MNKDEKTEGLASSTVSHRYGSVEYYLRDESHAISLATHARNAPYQGTSPRRPFPGVRRLYERVRLDRRLRAAPAGCGPPRRWQTSSCPRLLEPVPKIPRLHRRHGRLEFEQRRVRAEIFSHGSDPELWPRIRTAGSTAGISRHQVIFIQKCPHRPCRPWTGLGIWAEGSAVRSSREARRRPPTPRLSRSGKKGVGCT